MSLLDTALNETAFCVNMKSSAVVIRGCVILREFFTVYRGPMYKPMWEQLKQYTVFPLSQEGNLKKLV